MKPVSLLKYCKLWGCIHFPCLVDTVSVFIGEIFKADFIHI